MNLSDDQKDELLSRVADLQIQAMMFDMDIDYETLSLTERIKYNQPIWLQRYKTKLDESDIDQVSWDVDWE